MNGLRLSCTVACQLNWRGGFLYSMVQQAISYLIYAFRALGYQVTEKPVSDGLRCYFINNKDGSVRWIWPASNKAPLFLKFYYAGSWKSKLYVLLLKLMYRMKLQRWFSHGSCVLEMPVEDAALFSMLQAPWAMFTGTKGPNQKLVVYSQQQGGYFIKIPYGAGSFSILQKETLALQLLQEQPDKCIRVPACIAASPAYMVQQNIDNGMKTAPSQFLQLPQAPVQAWCLHKLSACAISQSTSVRQIAERLQTLHAAPNSKMPAHLLQKLHRLMDIAMQWQIIHEAPAHADCTPWNMLVNAQDVALIDWELYKPEAPALYDAFHFHYQTGILMGNQGFAAIRKQIDAWLHAWQQPLQQKGLQVQQLEQWYLLDVITYYACLYNAQSDWHMQVYWLLQTWSDALSYWLLKHDASAQRKLLLSDLGDWLQYKPHASLKMYLPHISELPLQSDVDICMPKKVANDMLQWLQQHPACRQMVERRRSNMTQVAVYLHNAEVLHIDAIWQLKRKELVFMDVAQILQQATDAQQGIRTANVVHDTLYTWLFYVLNNAAIPLKYQQHWQQLPAAQLKEVMDAIAVFLQAPADMHVLMHPSAAQRQQVYRYVQRSSANSGLSRLIHLIQYYTDMFRDWKNNRGFIITFSGVDGAGKSTIIEATRLHIEKVLRKRVVVLRHRPSLLPILSAWKHGKAAAEAKAAQTLPRQGNNKSSIGSMLRFAYYYTDYLIGQFYIQMKYVLRGYVVLYDRYYFDFINDSKRSNIQLPKFITTAGYALLLKPKLNFFLWATPEEILSRKQELNAETIVSLTQDYMQLFQKMQKKYRSSIYVIIHNQQLQQTMDTIFQQIQKVA